MLGSLKDSERFLQGDWYLKDVSYSKDVLITHFCLYKQKNPKLDITLSFETTTLQAVFIQGPQLVLVTWSRKQSGY